MVKRLKIKLILFLALFFFPQPLNAGDLTDFLIKNLKIQAGVSQHKLSSDYSYYKNLSEKVFNTEYKDVSTGRFLISWKDFFRYEKEIPLTSGSKKLKDKINLTENSEICIWGVVTYVIHAL